MMRNNCPGGHFVMMCAWAGLEPLACDVCCQAAGGWAHQPLKLILGLQLYSLYSFIDLFCIGTPRLPSSCLGAYSARWPGLRHNQQLAQRYHQQLNCFTWKPHKQRNFVSGKMTSTQYLLQVDIVTLYTLVSACPELKLFTGNKRNQLNWPHTFTLWLFCESIVW